MAVVGLCDFLSKRLGRGWPGEDTQPKWLPSKMTLLSAQKHHLIPGIGGGGWSCPDRTLGASRQFLPGIRVPVSTWPTVSLCWVTRVCLELKAKNNDSGSLEFRENQPWLSTWELFSAGHELIQLDSDNYSGKLPVSRSGGEQRAEPWAWKHPWNILWKPHIKSSKISF